MDRKKYIIEVSDDIQRVMAIGVAEDKTVFTCEVKVDALEELTADYINKHSGSLQDDAYKRGLEDGKKSGYEKGLNAVGTYRKGHAIGYDEGYEDGKNSYDKNKTYQRGLEDAWEAARRIVVDTDHGGLALGTLSEIFGTQSYSYIMRENTAQDAIAKLKAYEDKHSDRIEVGNEVKWNGDVIVITRVYEDGGFNWCDGISQDGRAFHVLAENVRKTGRHFDISSILEEMRQ